MEESTTYQYIVEQGELRESRRIVLKMGAIKFGAPTKQVKVAIQELENRSRLRRMAVRLLTANCWNEVLETR